jgi:predicted nucleotidyltransferase
LSQPNNQLGFAYSKEIAQSGYAIEIEAIPRKGVGYLEKNIQKHENIASATAIRTSLFETEDRKKTENYMPSNAYQLLEQTQWTNWDNYWPLLEYQLTTSSINQLQDIYQMEEGIEFRLKEAVQAASNMNDFLNQIKNKRVTWTRIQRLCLYVLFQMKKEEMMEELKRVKALHLLGFSSQGQKYISEKKSDLSIPLLANINQGNAHLWKQDIRVNEIYRLANKQKIMKQDFTRKPLKSVDIKKLH